MGRKIKYKNVKKAILQEFLSNKLRFIALFRLFVLGQNL